MSACRSCGRPIVWAHTEHGKRIPLDMDPYYGDDPRGLFILRRFDGTLTAVAVAPAAFEDERLYRSHFATCPDAARWRRTHDTEEEAHT